MSWSRRGRCGSPCRSAPPGAPRNAAPGRLRETRDPGRRPGGRRGGSTPGEDEGLAMKRLFGTDGIRGVAGMFPLDEATVVRIGRALAESLRATRGGPPRVVVGRDTRESGPAIEASLARGVVEAGGRVDLGGVLTTPAIACVTRLVGYDAGLVVSASHNPYRDNGIKIFSHTGEKLSDETEATIERSVLDGPGAHDPGGASPARQATAPAGCLDHALPGPPALDEVRRQNVRAGLAFDGDADRCLLVDSTGRLLDGDYVLYLAARDLKAAGRLRGNAVVGTVMSNLWLDRALRDEGIRLLRAPVGDKYVLEEMQRGGYVLGGEQSGHIICLERATTGDGLLTGLLVLDLLRRGGIDLSEWAASVRPCPQVLVNVPVRARPPLDSHPRIGPAIRDEERKLGDGGRLLVRYSGTEPKARIMVEGESPQAVEQTAARLKAIIQDEIGQEP